MTDHGIRHVHPVRRLGTLTRHYPWSIMWMMFTAAVSALAAGAYVPVLIIVILSCIIGLHASYHEHMEAKGRRR